VRHPSPPSATVANAGRSVSPSPQEGINHKSVRLLLPSPTNDECRHTSNSPPDPGQRSRTTSTEPYSPTSNSQNYYGQPFFSSGRFYDTPTQIRSSHSISSSEPYANRDGHIMRAPSFVPPVTYITDGPVTKLPPSPPGSASVNRSGSEAVQPTSVHSLPVSEVSTTASVNATREPLRRHHARIFPDAWVQKLRAQVDTQSSSSRPPVTQKDSTEQSLGGIAPTSREEILSVVPLTTSSTFRRVALSGQAPEDVHQIQDSGIEGGKKRRRSRSRSGSPHRVQSKRSPYWRPPTYDEERPFKRTRRDRGTYPRSSEGDGYLGSWPSDGARDAVQSTSEDSPESQQPRGVEEDQRSFSRRDAPERTGRRIREKELDYRPYDYFSHDRQPEDERSVYASMDDRVDRWAGGKRARYDASSSSRPYGGRPSGTLHPDHPSSHHWPDYDHTSATREDYRYSSPNHYSPSSAYQSPRRMEEYLDKWESSWRASHSRILTNVDYEFGCRLEEFQVLKSSLLTGAWSKDRHRRGSSDLKVLDGNNV